MASDLPPEWDRLGAAWGEDLYRRFPDGLGPEPDFERDGNARAIWSREGFARMQGLFASLGRFDDVPIGGKSFSHYPDNSVSDQIHIARTAFQLAQNYWHPAKLAADEEARKTRAAAEAVQERAEEMRRIAETASAADTVRQLEVLANGLDDRLAGATVEERAHIHAALSVVQKRMIEIERASARSASRWGWIGLIVGLIGLAFPVRDLISPHDCPAPPAATQLGSR